MRWCWLLMLVGCGRWVGNWDGSCEDPATGETREFAIDIDEDRGGEVAGTAFMTIIDDGGDSTIVNCEVSGSSNKSGVDFDFDCENGESFVVLTEAQGADLLGYCDNAQEIELLLVLD